MDRSSLSRRSLLAGGVLTGLSAACSRSRMTPTGMDKVIFRSELAVRGRTGYAWVAKAKGFFIEQNIDVTPVPGAAGDSNLTALAAGQVDFTTIDGTGALIRIANGQFDQCTMIASMHTGSLIAIQALPDRGITAASDLPGKTIIQTPGSVGRTLFPGYAKLASIDAAKVKWAQGDSANLPAILAAGKADAGVIFIGDTPSVATAAGRQPSDIVVLPYSQYMTDLIGAVVVTTRQLVQQNPDLVRRFTRALVQGLIYCGDNPTESANLLHQQVATVNPLTAAQEMTLVRPYISRTGRFNTTSVGRSFALLESLGQTHSVPDSNGPYLRTDIL